MQTNPSRLQGHTVLVSGAAVGQGREHARRLTSEGAAVILGDIQTEAVQELADELRGKGHHALAVTLDVTSEESWLNAVNQGVAEWGTITALINNAGIMSPGSAQTETVEDWNRTIAVNQTGMFLGIRTVAPVLIKNAGGSIVNVASTLGRFASTVGFAYQASKGAVRMMTKSAALELGTYGVRVNTILPGLVSTPFLGDAVERGALADPISRTPLGRIAQPEEIAAVAAFLISDDAAYVNAAEIVVDGGMTAGSLRSLKPTDA